MTGTLYITGKPDADRLLTPMAPHLLIGMLLDQQVPMEWAFTGPATLQARLGHLDASKIAAMDQEEFVAVCRAKPGDSPLPCLVGSANPRSVFGPGPAIRRPWRGQYGRE